MHDGVAGPSDLFSVLGSLSFGVVNRQKPRFVFLAAFTFRAIRLDHLASYAGISGFGCCFCRLSVNRVPVARSNARLFKFFRWNIRSPFLLGFVDFFPLLAVAQVAHRARAWPANSCETSYRGPPAPEVLCV
jgi:hypothetical protein